MNRAPRHKVSTRTAEQQLGFTLLELMVALAIFALLAVSGWQVFDGLNRAKERAQTQAQQLTDLQYAYLQIQQDMSQVVAWYNPAVSGNIGDTTNPSTQSSQNTTNPVPPSAFMLGSQTLQFVRFADPDPRYAISPTLVRVEYLISDRQLLRRQYFDLQPSTSSNSISSEQMTMGTLTAQPSLDSVLLSGIDAAQWLAYLPEPSIVFPAIATMQSSNLSNSSNSKQQPSQSVLPKGVGLQFSYHELPIEWRFALSDPAPQPIPAQTTPTPPA